MGSSSVRLLRKIGASLSQILVGVPIVSLLAGGLLLLVFGATFRGRSVGLSAAILGGVLYCSVGYWNRDWFKRIRRRFYALAIPAALLLYLVPMFLAPNGGKADGRVRNCFLCGQGAFRCYSPWNVVPESDQLAVGTWLLPLGEVDYAEASRIRRLLLPIYKDMDRDPEFHAAGSVMGMGYRELARMEFHTGHYYLFLPEANPGERLPCLVFLHGIGGNMKACLGLLSRLSHHKKCAVIAPTFGFGNWDKPAGARFVVDVVHEALATLPLDPDNVYLMGYSNGAMGVTRAAMEEPRLFRGLIYLSPVTEDEFFSTEEFLTPTRDRRILFLHGGRDKRIPQTFVATTVAFLRGRRCDVQLKIYEEEDHYLLFSRQETVLGDLQEFMRTQ